MFTLFQGKWQCDMVIIVHSYDWRLMGQFQYVRFRLNTFFHVVARETMQYRPWSFILFIIFYSTFAFFLLNIFTGIMCDAIQVRLPPSIRVSNVQELREWTPHVEWIWRECVGIWQECVGIWHGWSFNGLAHFIASINLKAVRRWRIADWFRVGWNHRIRCSVKIRQDAWIIEFDSATGFITASRGGTLGDEIVNGWNLF